MVGYFDFGDEVRREEMGRLEPAIEEQDMAVRESLLPVLRDGVTRALTLDVR